MLSVVYGSRLRGVEAERIGVEVSVSRGLGYQITGLAGDSIRESLARITIAIGNCGYRMPRTKVVINLTPADVRKTGTALDLPIALGILAASEQLLLPSDIRTFQIVGELGLDGSVYPVRGALCMAACSRTLGFSANRSTQGKWWGGSSGEGCQSIYCKPFKRTCRSFFK